MSSAVEQDDDRYSIDLLSAGSYQSDLPDRKAVAKGVRKMLLVPARRVVSDAVEL